MNWSFADTTARNAVSVANAPGDLTRSEDWWRGTFEHAAVGIAHVALDGRFLAVNDRFCAIVGHARESLLAAGFQHITHPQDLAEDEANVAALLAGRIPHYVMEKRYRRRDGGSAWAELTVGLVRDEHRQPAYFVSVVQDIGARREAEQALRIAAVTFESGDALAVADSDLRLLRVNAGLCVLTGHAAEDLVGQHLAVLLSDAEEQAGCAAGLAQVLRAGRWQGEVQARRRTGERFAAQLSASAVLDAQGRASHHVVALADITQHKQAQALLLRSQLELTRLTRRLMAQERVTTDRLAYLLNEGLGQTLSAMTMHIDLLDAHCMPGTACSAVEKLQRHASALSRQARQAIEELRGALAELHPPLLQEQGLVAALQAQLVRRRQEFPGISLELLADPALQSRRWPPDVEYAFFMVAREALDQAIDHGRAQHVQCVVGGSPDWLRLQLRDDGQGRPDDLLAPGQLGLVSMRERALAVGARLQWSDRAAGGIHMQLEWELAGDDPNLSGR
ncbi:PAS domain-containing sensor histidine kinase [Azohydromonas aeria]|uniref:PAS domain-containing sensor histidine kinase n=1 Tax=Azohydromonas aeria TaxID=2590212 RepID=UPI0018DFA927|nr:PAS domain S-box protein [Azohydromonas aeria]